MRRTIITLIVFCAVFAGCDQIEFPTIGNVPTNQACDTLFTFAGATGSHRNLLIEEFTGHLCGECPSAAHKIEELKDTYGDSIVVIAVHPNTSFNFVYPPDSTKFQTDWKTEEGEQTHDEFQIPSSLPRMMLNRKESTPPFYFFNANQLDSEVPALIGNQADFAIKCEGSMLADRTVCAKVEVEVLNDVSGSYSIVNCLLEDGIEDYQLVYDGRHPDYMGAPDETYPNYVHKHILRDIFGHFGTNEGGPALTGSIWGDRITGTTNSGDLKQFVISSTPLSSDWNENQISIVSFVYDQTTLEVLQVIETKITP